MRQLLFVGLVAASACGKDAASSAKTQTGSGSENAVLVTKPADRKAYATRLDVSKGDRPYVDAEYVFCASPMSGLYTVQMKLRNRSAEQVVALLHAPALSWHRTPSPRGGSTFGIDLMQFASQDWWEAKKGRLSKLRGKELNVAPGETKEYTLRYGSQYLLGCWDQTCIDRYAGLWDLVLRDVKADDAAEYTEQGIAHALIKPGGEDSKASMYFTEFMPADAKLCPDPPAAPAPATPNAAPPVDADLWAESAPKPLGTGQDLQKTAPSTTNPINAEDRWVPGPKKSATTLCKASDWKVLTAALDAYCSRVTDKPRTELCKYMLIPAFSTCSAGTDADGGTAPIEVGFSDEYCVPTLQENGTLPHCVAVKFRKEPDGWEVATLAIKALATADVAACKRVDPESDLCTIEGLRRVYFGGP